MFLLTESFAGIPGVTELVPSVRVGQHEWISRLARPINRLTSKNVSAATDMLRLALDFRRLVKATKPDIIHVHYAYSIWAWMTAVIGCHPLVVSIMGGDVLFKEQGSPTTRGIALTKQLLRSADLITAKSNFLIGVLNEIGGYGEKAIRVAWGVDPQIFRPTNATALRAELGIAPDALIVLSPKILQPFYNIHVLVEAMARIVAEQPRAHLVVTEYGADQAYKRELVAQIEGLGLAPKVTFTGRISYERMPAFYSLADVAVGVPHSDGLPQTLLEAMACGAPNVVGRLARYGEIVRDGESAVMVDIEPEGLAKGVLALLRDEALRRRISAAARDIVVAEANFPRDVERVEEHYYTLADRAGVQRPRPQMFAGVASYWLLGR